MSLNNLSFSLPEIPELLCWLKDQNSTYLKCNLACAQTFGLKKPESIIGLSDHELPCKLSSFAKTFVKHDKQVIHSNKPLKLLEIMQCVKDEWRIFFVIKIPLISIDGNIIGTSAHSIDITNILKKNNFFLSLATSTHKIIAESYTIGSQPDHLTLTSRQSEVLFYLIRGISIKQIASILDLSIRTVMDHIDKMKLKFDCATKQSLISFAIENNFMANIPESIFKQQVSIILPD